MSVGATGRDGSEGRTMTPNPGHVYIGGPTIKPEWLRGRRILVMTVPTRDECYRMSGYRHIPDSDIAAAKGDPLPDLTDDAPTFCEVHVLARGRVEYEQVNLKDWDARLA